MRYLLVLLSLAIANVCYAAEPCTATQREQMRSKLIAPAVPGDDDVVVTCSATLRASDKVTRRVIFWGNSSDGVTLDCAGATIDGGASRVCLGGTKPYTSCTSDSQCSGGGTCVYPRESKMLEVKTKLYENESGLLIKNADGLYKRDRPEGVKVKGCTILGGVHVRGLGGIGQSEHVKTSSHDLAAPGHVARARDAAPTDITFDDVTVIPSGDRIAIYLGPGTNRFTLVNSELAGHGNLAMYLDAESYKNVIKKNYIHTKTAKREQMALDGSSYNVIMGNSFHELDDGGIYVYRNCGEEGATRYSTPTHNQIINNSFYYANYKGSEDAVRLGARNASSSYCGLDNGWDIPGTSSSSDWDYARYNVVMQNRIVDRPVNDFITTLHTSVNSPNYIAYNETVSSTPARPSGCFMAGGYVRSFIGHGAVAPMVESDDGVAVCVNKHCTDGVLETLSSCSMRTVSFECRRTSDNAGCSGLAICPFVPSGLGLRQTDVIGAKAGCDLETASVTSSELASILPGRLKVLTSSDNVSDGTCFVGDTEMSSLTTYINGRYDVHATSYGCQEHDSNGGDCQIRGTLYCQ